MLQGVEKRQQVLSNQNNALGLEGTAKASDRRGKMCLEKLRDLSVGETWPSGALQQVSEHKSALLELRKNGVGRLPFCGKLNGFEKLASLAFEKTLGRVEKIGAVVGRNATEKKRLNMNWAVARGPLEPSKAPGDVLR